MAEVLFSGSSRYASDFEAIIDRAIAIASLPLQQMQGESSLLSAESSAISGLDGKVDALQTALTTLENSLGSGSFSATISKPDLMSASVSAGALEGSYEVEIVSLGSYFNSMSNQAETRITDPGAQNIATGTLYVKVGTADAVAVSGANLNALVADINEKLGSTVQATIVNAGGPGTAADYRISLQGRRYSSDTIKLATASDGTGNLLQDPPLTGGASVSYKINGAAAVVTESRNIELSTGLTVTLKSTDDENTKATITVARSKDAVKTALTAFANAYNAVIDELDLHRGAGTGALKGHSIVFTVEDTLRRIATWSTGESGISSLASFGVELTDKGKLNVDVADPQGVDFEKAVQQYGLNAIVDWLGKMKTGGFLKGAGGMLVPLEDSKSGALNNMVISASSVVTEQGKRIEAEEKRIDDLRLRLQEQFSAADALIASLEQQASYINGLFESMRIASQSNNG